MPPCHWEFSCKPSFRSTFVLYNSSTCLHRVIIVGVWSSQLTNKKFPSLITIAPFWFFRKWRKLRTGNNGVEIILRTGLWGNKNDLEYKCRKKNSLLKLLIFMIYYIMTCVKEKYRSQAESSDWQSGYTTKSKKCLLDQCQQSCYQILYLYVVMLRALS